MHIANNPFRNYFQIRSHHVAFTLVELLVVFGIIGLLGALLLPILGGSKDKARRAKCVQNLRQIGTTLISFAQENDGRMPWQLSDEGKMSHFGHFYKEDSAAVFSVSAIQKKLAGSELVLSPCDPGRKAANDDASKKWQSFDVRIAKLVPRNAISYVLLKGGDAARPSTILAATRNLSSCDLKSARWVGPGDQLKPGHVMGGLSSGQGQYVLADGSAHLSNNGDLGATGRVVQTHINDTGGVAGGYSSTKLLDCAGGLLGGIAPGQGQRFVYIIDKSGSMWTDRRFAVAQQALIEALENLSADKKFFVYFFTTRHQPMPAPNLLPASPGNVRRIASWIRGQRAGGGTDPRGALEDAFRTKNPDTIWLLTDGYFWHWGRRETAAQQIARLNSGKKVRVNTIGFARSENRVDRSLRAIAEQNGGEYRFYNSLETR
ncbi:MAG: hypothetical protein VX705_01715 [Verrucomicrobiota bacterium]|nr:hypothetical protein [Verrucomicrobiota bacterium]